MIQEKLRDVADTVNTETDVNMRVGRKIRYSNSSRVVCGFTCVSFHSVGTLRWFR
jgi:hypothetical protein